MSIFGGLPLPWTSEAANKIGQELVDKTSSKAAVASKKLSPEEMARLKATLAKPVISKKSAPTTPSPAAEKAPAKKGFLGLF